MRIPRWIWPLIPISLWLSGGCVGLSQQEYDLFIDQIRIQRQQQATITGLKKQVAHMASIVGYCSDEEQQLLANVQKSCQSDLVCTSSSIPIEVIKIDPYHQGRFMTLLAGRKHALFYFPAEGRELNEPEQKRLRDLVRPAWMDDGVRRTRFLVVAHPEDEREGSRQRAARRAQHVIDAIGELAGSLKQLAPAGSVPQPPLKDPGVASSPPVSASPYTTASLATSEAKRDSESLSAPLSSGSKGLIREGRVLYWIFPFSNPRERANLPSEDRPTQPGDQITRSVAVYRVDC